MCVRWKKDRGKITGITFDYKASLITMSGLMVIFSFMSAVKINCNSSGTFAKEHLIRPVAESTFVRMHKPFEDKLEQQCYDIKLTRLMVSRTTPDSIRQECIRAMKGDTTWRVQ